MLSQTSINLKGGKLQSDDVFPNTYEDTVENVLKMKGRKGYEKMIFSGGKLVNIVSKNYGHLTNENFFLRVEEELINAGLHNYLKRSINRNDCSFAVDYILNDDSYEVKVNGNVNDKIKPMLRFTNSYDGSAKTSGHFGFFREVCSNGLHIATMKVSFNQKHTKGVNEIVIPKIGEMVGEFMSNEFYTIEQKFEVLSQTKITDVQAFVRDICEKTDVLKFHDLKGWQSKEKSEKIETLPPAKNATIVIDSIIRESLLLNTEPNLWLGYNAFNEILHNGFVKSFDIQKSFDAKIFETVLEMAN